MAGIYNMKYYNIYNKDISYKKVLSDSFQMYLQVSIKHEHYSITRSRIYIQSNNPSYDPLIVFMIY